MDTPAAPQKSSEAGGQPRVPLHWRRLMTKTIDKAAYAALSWSPSQNGTFFQLGDDRPLKLTVVTSPDGSRAKTVQTDNGHSTPAQLCDEWWQEAYEMFECERDRRNGNLLRIVAQLEMFDAGGELLGESMKVVRPDPEAGTEHGWVTDAESEEERRDRGLLTEMRRERRQLFDLCVKSLNAATGSMERMGASVNAMQEEREGRLETLRNEAETYAVMAESADSEGKGMELLMEIFRDAKASHQVRPNAQGVDELVAECRSISDLITGDAWAKLVALHGDFALLRDAILGSVRHDATRPKLREGLLAALAKLSTAPPDSVPTPDAVRGAIGAAACDRIEALKTLLK